MDQRAPRSGFSLLIGRIKHRSRVDARAATTSARASMPIGAKAAPMPDHGFGLDRGDRIQNRGEQPVQPPRRAADQRPQSHPRRGPAAQNERRKMFCAPSCARDLNRKLDAGSSSQVRNVPIAGSIGTCSATPTRNKVLTSHSPKSPDFSRFRVFGGHNFRSANSGPGTAGGGDPGLGSASKILLNASRFRMVMKLNARGTPWVADFMMAHACKHFRRRRSFLRDV